MTDTTTIKNVKEIINRNVAGASAMIRNSAGAVIEHISASASIDAMTAQLSSYIAQKMSENKIDLGITSKEKDKTSGGLDNVERVANKALDVLKGFTPAAIAGVVVGAIAFLIIVIVLATVLPQQLDGNTTAVWTPPTLPDISPGNTPVLSPGTFTYQNQKGALI